MAAFGASFDETDPALVSLLAQVERARLPSIWRRARPFATVPRLPRP